MQIGTQLVCKFLFSQRPFFPLKSFLNAKTASPKDTGINSDHYYWKSHACPFLFISDVTVSANIKCGFSVSVEQTKNSVLTEKEFSVAALRRYSLISVPLYRSLPGKMGGCMGTTRDPSFRVSSSDQFGSTPGGLHRFLLLAFFCHDTLLKRLDQSHPKQRWDL